MEVIRTLAEAGEPLAFSDLYERVSATDSGNFTYHLDKLVGHFVADTEEGYELRRTGERIVEAVVSGAVTETPEIEPTRIDWPCNNCGASIVVSYQQEWVAASCTECAGAYDPSETDDPVHPDQHDHGYLGGLSLPPAATRGRDAAEVNLAALSWDFLERMALSNDICPRCSAPVERELTVCEDHDGTDSLCSTCGRQSRELFTVDCPNCPLQGQGLLGAAIHGYPDVLDFVTAHGFNPVRPDIEQWEAMRDAIDVEVVSTRPVRVRITYSHDGKTLRLVVDEDLEVTDVDKNW